MLRRWMTTLATTAAVAFVAGCAQPSEVGTTMEPGAETQEGVIDTLDETEDPDVTVGEALPSTWQAIATKTEAAGEISVRAEIAIRDKQAGGTFASIALEGGEENHTYPWHIHSGDCGSGGSIVGDPAAYQPVTTGADGEGQATADLALELEADADYYVNVHKSPSETGTIVACGEVESQ